MLITGTGRPHAKSLNSGQNGGPSFPPPKTDKPRPHICATCTRSFARLEHLKRHERSHTKEKPFACPECTRCFARRDLLLRHQQKLHLTALPASRQRGQRRESTSSTAASGPTKVRKNSMVNNSGGVGAGSMRPRANTISHVDNSALGLLAAANSSASRNDGLGLGPSNYSDLPGVGNYHPRGMASAAGHHGKQHVLPKLETKSHGIDIGASLRTAPALGGFGSGMDMDNLWYGPGSSTINPAQLHFSESPQFGTFDEQPPYHQNFPAYGTMDSENAFGWVNTFENQLSFNNFNEQAIDGSSPSTGSTSSPSAMSEVMLDGSHHTMNTPGLWNDCVTSQAPFSSAYAMNIPGLPFSEQLGPGQMSPKSLHTQMANGEQYFPSPPMLPSQTPLPMTPGMVNPYFQAPTTVKSETPSNSAASISSSNRQSSVTSVSTDSITDATRQALIMSLSQPSMYSHMRSSQPQVSSPLSPGFPARTRSVSNVPMPSTYDLQRYVAAYIQYFHPHLPFLHVSSLSFDTPAFTTNLRASSGQFSYGQSGVTGGGGSLVLAMAAIGALYEYDFAASMELFEMAKKLIQLYLEERRKADMSAALTGNHNPSEIVAQNTPLWLVQAMLLNVIYGHNCGDKTLAGIASTHCAALVNLARAADLTKPLSSPFGHDPFQHMNQDDMNMGGHDIISGQWSGSEYGSIIDVQNEWMAWKSGEERKRTLYAVFILSSLCVSAYNHAPALMNSEIGLDLPCDENLWSADSAESWRSLGGNTGDHQRSTSFAAALSDLLTASQRSPGPQRHYSHPIDHPTNLDGLPESRISPSSFGCLVLINALHNYIWETRQRHAGRRWTTQETEAMHARIEPALRAWYSAWRSNPEHSSERPNPFGATSLSADCIPHLDLAYVRLFVNFGRSKEAFFRRDFNAMAVELARGMEIIQHADYNSESHSSDPNSASNSDTSSPINETPQVKIEDGASSEAIFSEQPSKSGLSSKRERHLRKASFYAANALEMSDKLGVTFADHSSRELPVQSALCAFDCAQVLAEWVSSLQQRVGRYLGILGKDEIDYTQVPAIMLLEEDDCKLLDKIHGIITNAEMKLADSGSMGLSPMAAASGPFMEDCGYGGKILLIHARMFERAAVWPGKLQ